MIFVNKPSFSGNEKKYLLDCIKTGWISSEGKYVKRFEKKFAKFVNRKFSTTVTNGSVALEIAIRALNLKKGSEVILPTFTIISCCNAVINAGLKPVLVDCYLNTYNMNVSQVEDKINKNTSAILMTHIYGITVDVDKILYLAKKYKLKVIEDAAEVHGQKYKKKNCGSFGDISTFSFYVNKHITTGEGGMILTNNQNVYKYILKLKNLYFGKGLNRFRHQGIGWNQRFTNIQAAIGLAQLENIKKTVKKKHAIGEYYTKKLSFLSEKIQLPLTSIDYCQNIYWVYGILVKDNQRLAAKKVIKMLKKEGIECRPFFSPMHEQPIYLKMQMFKNKYFPISEKISKKGFYIPSGIGITRKEQDIVIKKITKVFEN
ncbi:MAG: aminotransferase DegT [Candidatus Marinimicrobia bacterium]|nr:aminotransferase DegT [Candidatus Neomarinimicrobiota bacterium]